MKILDHYIRRIVIVSTLMVSMVIVGLQSFLLLVQQFRLIGTSDYTFWKASLFVLMQLPAQFYQLFPMAGFLGALIGLSRLSSSSQLIVMRSAGISVLRIAWSVLKTGLIMVIVVTALGEYVGPTWQQQSEQMQEKALSPSSSDSLLSSVWLRSGNSFTHISELKNGSEMEDITRYRFAPSGRLERATSALSGELKSGEWELSNLKKSIFMPDKILSEVKNNSELDIIFHPNLQLEMSISSAEQTIVDLYQTIQYRRMIGLGTSAYQFSFWQRVLQPLTTLIMICLSVPFVFGSFRSSSMSMRIIVGVVVGFIFYMLNQLFGPIVMVYQFPPVLAAIIPTVLFFMITLVLLVRTQ